MEPAQYREASRAQEDVLDKKGIMALALCGFVTACGAENADETADPGGDNAATGQVSAAARQRDAAGAEFLGRPTGYWIEQISGSADAPSEPAPWRRSPASVRETKTLPRR
jgi:hypothetical protein